VTAWGFLAYAARTGCWGDVLLMAMIATRAKPLLRVQAALVVLLTVFSMGLFPIEGEAPAIRLPRLPTGRQAAGEGAPVSLPAAALVITGLSTSWSI
jgi:hypothetical protein